MECITVVDLKVEKEDLAVVDLKVAKEDSVD